MNNLAQVLNDTLIQENINVFNMLSTLGKELYYPKGILTQSAEAKEKATRFNATIGIATLNGESMHFQHIQDTLSAYSPDELYDYAPPSGKESLRAEWKKKMLRENSSLKDKNISNPIVTGALTHGLSIVADLFVDEGDTVILPDKYWGNYNLIFGIRRKANIETYPLFDQEGRFNIAGLSESIAKQSKKAIVLLNFPNNPTGYTPNEEEAKGIVEAVKSAAKVGKEIVVLVDDAYYNLFYDDTAIKESIFSKLANVHDSVLCVKIDGATKENYAWGFRVGFITYAAKSKKVLHVLEEKTKGIIRGTISSAPHPSQTFILKAMQSDCYEEERELKLNIMKKRAAKVKEVLQKPKFAEVWTPYPFNSGYFMCLRLNCVSAHDLRKSLLENRGIGTISINETDLRIAFSCVEEQDIEQLYDEIYQEIKIMQEK
ncbi:Aminotran-1-2 domain-containing protein [Bacillus subtilis]|nr:aminotransferase class I/II-fold pyridoxal phosphate-dependent enzyme [Bacillus subtilis]CAF1770887.1 Aspartate aminotransferase [Bacillus subtilis]CAI6291115.1 Aminotran-1-2 domain-containing protein [Bacillus subtilis]